MRADRTSGFTLIELVIVMVVISVSLLGLASMFITSTTSLSTNENLQQVTQSAQECAEKAIATRRSLGFAWFATNTLACGQNTDGTPVASVGSPYSGTASTACPDGVSCRDIAITVKSGSLSSSIAVMLVNY